MTTGDGAGVAFVPPRWPRSVGTGESIDRRELCALSELKYISIASSRQLRSAPLHPHPSETSCTDPLITIIL